MTPPCLLPALPCAICCGAQCCDPADTCHTGLRLHSQSLMTIFCAWISKHAAGQSTQRLPQQASPHPSICDLGHHAKLLP
jgi:hypothetical protein